MQLEGLGKQYSPTFWGLQDLTLNLEPGVTGLLGENGAGKSTLMRIMATITAPTTGRVLWNGTDTATDPDSLRRVLGYLPQDFGVYPGLNAVEFMEYIGAMKGVERKRRKQRIEELLQLVNLTDVRKRPVGSYSGGMKQRLGIAQALINDPEILIVDEPTVGLDPTERVRFRNLLSDIAENRIVIFSTHIVPDVEATASRIAVMAKGRLLSYSEPQDLLHTVQGKVWELTIDEASIQDVRQKHIISATVRTAKGIRARVISDNQPLPQATSLEPTLEDAYLFAISSHKAATSNE